MKQRPGQGTREWVRPWLLRNTVYALHKAHLKATQFLIFIIRFQQETKREEEQQHGRSGMGGRKAQNLTWARKCICLVALFCIPVFSIHLDFILCTYCMSRPRTRAVPAMGKAREVSDPVGTDHTKPRYAVSEAGDFNFFSCPN